ncbi:MAG: ATP-binding protein [Campylobacterota bacterium]|nr:ATP-binding protein [Campylobacterota bacterium]
MKIIKQSKTHKQLILLITIFLIGFFSLFSLNQIFINLVNNLDNKTKNLESRINIGEFISYDIVNLRALFHELATTTTSQKSRDLIKEKIDDTIDVLNESIEILEYGGTLKRFVALNVAGHQNTIKTIKYNKVSKNDYSLEVIDLKPKLIELRNMVSIIEQKLIQRFKLRKTKNIKEFTKSSREIRRYYKTLPAYFTRLSENLGRLLYEGEIELNILNKQISQDKERYMKLKVLLIFCVITIVLIFGFIIIRNVNKDSQALFNLNNKLNINLEKQENQEKYVRAILDAQPNIIMVSDGKEMIDANLSLLKFFDKFKDFETFRDEIQCICNFFETTVPNDDYIINKDYDGLSWSEYILNNQDKEFKIIMKKNGKKHHFSITAMKTVLNENTNESVVIVTLNDITSEINSQIKLKSLNDNLELLISNKTKELQELNENLEQKIIIETLKVREKDKQMIQQSRFAALGEMIGNIAHQWRQPLSAINTTASGMSLQMQLGIASNDDIDESYTKIMGYVDFLTQTIEDFRGFFHEDKDTVDFNITETIDKTLTIISPSYKDNDIEIIKHFPDYQMFSHGMPNELAQVFLNILNNAKDATISNEIKNRYVSIRCEEKDNQNIIYIQDNAGGIPQDIIEKIFDPYFTTKHQSQGTGIGLYMSRDIVEKTMNGSISVRNMSTIIDDKNYDGACFIIKLNKI